MDKELIGMNRKEDLMYFLSGWELDDLADGAWWAYLEEGVQEFNKERGTEFDQHQSVLDYIEFFGEEMPKEGKI